MNDSYREIFAELPVVAKQYQRALTDRQMSAMPKWAPDEPFANVPALERMVALSRPTLECAMSTRTKPRQDYGAGQALLLPRLPFKALRNGPGNLIAAVPFSGGVAWLLQVTQSLTQEDAEGMMKAACLFTSRQRVVGSGCLTGLAKKALAAYREKWPRLEGK